MPNNWLFVSNPARDNLLARIQSGELQPGGADFGPAKENAARMQPGDRIFHWVTGQESGLVAVSTLTSRPQDGQVGFQLETILPTVLGGEELRADPELAEVPCLQDPRQTNMAVDPLTAANLSRRCGLQPLWPFTTADLVEVLQLKLKDPRVLTAQGWQDCVGQRVGPFFDALKAILPQVGVPKELVATSPRQNVRKARQYFASLSIRLTRSLTLSVYLGLDDKNGVYEHQLCYGLTWLGKNGLAEGVARQWPARPGLQTNIIQGGLWAASTVVIQGHFQTPEALARLSADDLLRDVQAVLGELYRDRCGIEASPLLSTLAEMGGKAPESELVARAGLLGPPLPHRQACLRLWLQDLIQGTPTQWALTSQGRQRSHLEYAATEEPLEPSLELASSEADILDSLRNYGAASQEEQRDVPLGEYFVYDPVSGWVAPCKFAGFKGMTIGRYRELLRSAPSMFDGHKARVATQELLGEPLPENLCPGGYRWVRQRVGDREVKVFAVGDQAEQRPLLDRFIEQLKDLRRDRSHGDVKIHKPLLTLAALLATGYNLELSYEELARYTKCLESVMGTDTIRIDHPFPRLAPGQGDLGLWNIIDAGGEIIDDISRDQRKVLSGTHIAWLHGYEKCIEDHRVRSLVVEALLEQIGNNALKDQLSAERPVATGALPPPEIVHPQLNLATIIDDFSDSLWTASLRFGPRQQHSAFVRSFMVSLATKRFAILTGLSGSGKSQIALRLGEWFGRNNMLVLPVRPDWTGPEALLGYEDALREMVGDKRVWSVPPALAFMLRAANDPQRPFLLVLDEMNLAHVERYFADILSGMESNEPCLPNLLEDLGRWVPEAGARGIPFPGNLFIVGTVNVDETTYMFSPKVLDRANTLEFRVTTQDLSAEMGRPKPVAPGAQASVLGFLAFARDFEHTTEVPEQATFAAKLLEVHQKLSAENLEFGHRVFYEALRFHALYTRAGGSTLEALDLQVMQKVLPRLHGGRGKLEATLQSLLSFAQENQLRVSQAKLERMLRNLQSQQFTSFLE